MLDQANHKILEAELRYIFRHSQTAYIASTAVQSFMLIGLWPVYSHFMLLFWFFVMQIALLLHFFLSWKYTGKELSFSQAHYVKVSLICICFFIGSLWGSFAWLLDGSWDSYALFIILPMLGIFSGAINLAPVLPVYFSLTVPIMLQVIAALLFSDAANSILAGFFAIFFAGMIKISFDHNKMVRHNYKLRFELETSNKELVFQKQAAEKANIDKSRFLAAASHDLRQPLYAMELFLGSLSQKPSVEKRDYLLSRLRNTLDSMLKMFSSLLDMSRFDAGVISPERKNFPANYLFKSLKMKFEEECVGKGIKLMIRPTREWIYSDSILIQRVLENFIGNAVKYTNFGGVLVACRKQGKYCRFEVWDTGRGIKEENVGVIFDAFYQLENPERDRKQGVGLGLSIVEQISKLLTTKICVRSRFGKGSVFSIDVPIGKEEHQIARKSNEVLSLKTNQFFDLVVWIVDDDDDILDGLQLLLETWGCVTRTFSSLEKVKTFMGNNSEVPELLISDFRLREHKTGIEVIDFVRINCRQKTLPAIIITGDTGPERLQEVSAIGLPLLHKPVTAEKLQMIISKIVF